MQVTAGAGERVTLCIASSVRVPGRGIRLAPKDSGDLLSLPFMACQGEAKLIHGREDPTNAITLMRCLSIFGDCLSPYRLVRTN